jgi:putative endonuclease
LSYFTYILKSLSVDRIYIGQTNNLESRLIRHNAGSVPSTKPYRPWELIYFKEFNSRKEAMNEESRLKQMKSKEYILNYIVSLRHPDS